MTFSRPLTSNLDLQIAAARKSRSSTAPMTTSRAEILPPKGSVTLGWRPAKDWDASLKLRRRVGQISFYDFLAQPKLSQDRENAGNPDLVPPQSWEVGDRSSAHDLGSMGQDPPQPALLPGRRTSST